MFLSVIIPAYNEEKRLPETLRKVREYLSAQSYNWEVLVVNDGSVDQTAQVVNNFINSKSEALNPKQIQNDLLKAKFEYFKLINNEQNKGKGGVVKQGMLEAKGEWRLFMDADGSTAIEELDKLWKFAKLSEISYRKVESSMENGKQKSDIQFPNQSPISSNQCLVYEVIIGSRYLNKDSIKVKQPLVRRIVSRLGNVLVRVLLGIKAADTQCGFKLFSAEATEKIFPLQQIMRWGFDMEILAIAIKKGYKIKEVAVDWYDAEGSQVKKSAALKTLKELWQIKKNIIKGKYQ